VLKGESEMAMFLANIFYDFLADLLLFFSGEGLSGSVILFLLLVLIVLVPLVRLWLRLQQARMENEVLRSTFKPVHVHTQSHQGAFITGIGLFLFITVVILLFISA
jgi:tryptophan-rich sensory protein